jgi:hypothetical protein
LGLHLSNDTFAFQFLGTFSFFVTEVEGHFPLFLHLQQFLEELIDVVTGFGGSFHEAATPRFCYSCSISRLDLRIEISIKDKVDK